MIIYLVIGSNPAQNRAGRPVYKAGHPNALITFTDCDDKGAFKGGLVSLRETIKDGYGVSFNDENLNCEGEPSQSEGARPQMEGETSR
jgi:hypothetical protein